MPGIGGNQVVGPAKYSAQKPCSGRPSALQRLDRDVLSLSGVTAVIWLEGINDSSSNANATVDAVGAGMKEGLGRIRAKTAWCSRDRRDHDPGWAARARRMDRAAEEDQKRKTL